LFKVINVEPLTACQQLLLRYATSLCLSASARRDNSNKIATFYGLPLFDAHVQRPPKGSGLKLLKSKFNAENFICKLSWSISSHFGAIYF